MKTLFAPDTAAAYLAAAREFAMANPGAVILAAFVAAVIFASATQRWI